MPYPFAEAPLAGDPLAEAPERAELRRTLRALIERESPPQRIDELDRSLRFDDALYARLAEIGVLGIDAPERFGGSGDVRDQLVVIEELAAGPTSMAAWLIGEFAVVQLLAKFGRQPEHGALLRRIVAGEAKVSFALSEPAGGTDVARAMRTRAERTPGGFRLRGHKAWTSGAALAEAIVVLARTSDSPGSPVHGITMFLVPAHAPGVEIREIDTLGIHSLSTCDVFLDGVEVPETAVVGDVDRGMRQV